MFGRQTAAGLQLSDKSATVQPLAAGTETATSCEGKANDSSTPFSATRSLTHPPFRLRRVRLPNALRLLGEEIGALRRRLWSLPSSPDWDRQRCCFLTRYAKRDIKMKTAKV